jgi:hypothetical protein
MMDSTDSQISRDTHVLKAVSKSQAHGQIGESAVIAKCWMNGLAAYRTGSLTTHFAGADVVVARARPERPVWIEVKSGYPVKRDHVYLTQFSSDDKHQCDDKLDFSDLSFYVVPRDDANALFHAMVDREANTVKRDGKPRSLRNLAVHAPTHEMKRFYNAWGNIRDAQTGPL